MQNSGFLIIWLVFLLGIMYLLMVRPQQKRIQAHRELVQALKPGDRVITIGGIYGTVIAMADENFDLRIADDVVVTVTKNAIAMRVPEPGSESAPGDTDGGSNE